jgi:hypothetical protein
VTDDIDALLLRADKWSEHLAFEQEWPDAISLNTLVSDLAAALRATREEVGELVDTLEGHRQDRVKFWERAERAEAERDAFDKQAGDLFMAGLADKKNLAEARGLLEDVLRTYHAAPARLQDPGTLFARIYAALDRTAPAPDCGCVTDMDEHECRPPGPAACTCGVIQGSRTSSQTHASYCPARGGK